MDNRQSTRMQTIRREKALYRYMAALERGDVDTLAAILFEAEQDEVLERTIIEVHRSYRTEEDKAAYGEGLARMRQLLDQYKDVVSISEQVAIAPEAKGKSLNVREQKEAYYIPAGGSMVTLFKRLKEVGLNKDFVLRRLIPRKYHENVQEKDTIGAAEVPIEGVLQMLQRIFNWEPATLFGSTSLLLDMATVGTTRFKKAVNSDVQRISAYSIYAHYLALLVLKATPDLPRKPVFTEPDMVRKEVLSTYGALTFEHVLRYVWDLGIPVLPLNDRGNFHGACWRMNSRNVIVLKQQTTSDARWLFDLLHELRHAGQNPDQDQFAVVEVEEMSQKYKHAEEEQIASQFAGDVLLDGRAEDLAQICVQATKRRPSSAGSLELLKQIVPTIAQREHVSTDALANYMAFRLSLQGENWWGTAMSLQQSQGNGWKIARGLLLQRVNLQSLDETDRDLLLNALSYSED